jgi:tetratricopeptide (TPR) repeat protein
MKKIFFLITCHCIYLLSNACGNAYYYADRELPLKNGFIDYYKLLIAAEEEKDSLHSNHHHEFNTRHDGGKNPYFFPIQHAQGKWSNEHYRDISIDKLRDTLFKIIGNPVKRWKFTDKELGVKAIALGADYKLLSDFAWKLAQKMDLEAAEKILSTIVAKYPKEYNINANLGTVYELLGKNQLALAYIGKAMEISPKSHYGSEWLHINILKRKLGLFSTYDYNSFFEMNNSLKISYSDILYSKNFLPQELGKYHRDTLMVHLAYQLHERMFFINNNDPIMAEMLYMFMQCMIHRGDYEYAAHVGRLVLQYDKDYMNNRVFDALAYCLKRKKAA